MRFARCWTALASLTLSFLPSACHCDCDPPLEIVLSTLDASVEQSVRVEFRRGDVAEPW
jgi:hypothetical protein